MRLNFLLTKKLPMIKYIISFFYIFSCTVLAYVPNHKKDLVDNVEMALRASYPILKQARCDNELLNSKQNATRSSNKKFCDDPYGSVCNYKQDLLDANLRSYTNHTKAEYELKVQKIFSKKNIAKFIDTYIRHVNSQNLSKELKKQYRKKLNSLKFFAEVNRKDTGSIPYIRNYLCGVDNSIANAAAIPSDPMHSKIKGHVIICKKLIKSIINYDDTDTQAWSKLSFILGHEIGHLLYGKKVFWQGDDIPENYGCWYECTVNNDSQRLLLKGDGKKPATYKWYNFFSKYSRVSERSAELVADYWGEGILGEHLSRISPKERLTQLRQAVGFLCETPDEGIHPIGGYRIARTLRNNKKIKELFNCKENRPADDDSCVLAPDSDCGYNQDKEWDDY